MPLPLCYINFIPGRETISQFCAGAAGKNWAWLPSFYDESEQGQQKQQQRDARMVQMFSSIIHNCTGDSNVVLGMNPTEPINATVLQAAAVDLSRLKAM
jgi:hypothetical protein